MVEVLRENLVEAGIDNVEIVQGPWPDVQVEQHDFTLCSHAMYGFADFPGFVRSVMAATKDTPAAREQSDKSAVKASDSNHPRTETNNKKGLV